MEKTGRTNGQGCKGMGIAAALVLAAVVLSAGAAPAFGLSVTLSASSTADNYYDLYVDGGAPKISIGRTSSGWNSPEYWSQPVDPDTRHVIAVKASNYTPWTSGANPAGFLAQVSADNGLAFQETRTGTLVTDSSWKVWYGGVSATPPVINGLTWTDPGYDDSAWAPAYQICHNGQGVWGTVSPISTSAYWIWTTNYSGNSADTPVYFRKTLTPMSGGMPVPEPLTLAGAVLGLGTLGGYVRRRRNVR